MVQRKCSARTCTPATLVPTPAGPNPNPCWSQPQPLLVPTPARLTTLLTAMAVHRLQATAELLQKVAVDQAEAETVKKNVAVEERDVKAMQEEIQAGHLFLFL